MTKEILRKKQKYITYGIVLILLVSIIAILINSTIFAKKWPKSDVLDEFPASYKVYIDELKKKHPNWTFKAVYNHLDWQDSIKMESYDVHSGRSTVHDSKSGEWKKDGQNYYIDGPYVTASKKAIAYVMDPRNFLNETGIFQFELLDYNEKTSRASTIEKIVAGTPMSTYPTQYKKAGKMETLPNNRSWVDIINLAAKDAGTKGISSVFLASRMKQETSLDILNNGSANGSVSGYEGIYNFLNIGASPSYAGAKDAVTNGLKNASTLGWTDPEKSIRAGAKEIWSSYIKWGQNTVYFQKFDVSNVNDNAVDLYKYQYMTNIMAPSNESMISYNAYKNCGMLDESFVFYIPVYDNMPNRVSPHPESEVIDENITGADLIYIDDGVVNGTDVVNIRTGPGTEYDVLYVVRESVEGADNRTKYTRIERGNNGWDKIRLGDGREGYVYQSYVREYNYTKVTSISLDKTSLNLKVSDTNTIKANVLPNNAYIKNITYSSENSNIATVDANGKITAINVGETNIVVTTLDGNKIAKCKIIVGDTKATSIAVGGEKYPLVLGNYLQLNPVIMPTTTTNKQYNIVVEDQTVATVENGKIKGLKLGETKVTLTTKDGSNKSCSFSLKVTEKIAEVKNYPVDSNGIISNISINTLSSTIKNNIETSYTKKVIDVNGNEIKDTDKLGTGAKVQIISNGAILQEYTLAVTGDLNGDTKSTASDYVIIKNYIMDITSLNDVQKIAADMNKDNKITASDYVLVKNYIMQN